MPTTSRGYPYPTPSDPPDGPDQIQDLAVALNTDVGSIDTRVGTLELEQPLTYPRIVPNAATGSPGIGGATTFTIASQVIPDPGYPYYIEAGGTIFIGIFGGATTSLSGIYVQINVDEAAFNPTPSSRIIQRTAVPTGPMPQLYRVPRSFHRSSFTGSHTVYFLLRNDSVPSNFLTYSNNEYYTFDVRAIPA